MAQLKKELAPPPPPPRPPEHRLSWKFYTGLASAGAGLGLLSFGVLALAANGRCIDEVRPCDMRYDSLVQGAWTTALGGVLIAGGVVLFSLDLHRRGTQRRLALRVPRPF